MEIRVSFSEKLHYAEGKFPLATGILFLEGKFWEIFIWIAKGATKTFYTLSNFERRVKRHKWLSKVKI